MSAYEVPNLRFSEVAGTNLARRRLVTVNTSGELVYAGAESKQILGATLIDAKAKETVSVADGIVIVEAEDAITMGSEVELGTDGKVKAKAMGTGIAVALTASSGAGNFISIKL